MQKLDIKLFAIVTVTDTHSMICCDMMRSLSRQIFCRGRQLRSIFQSCLAVPNKGNSNYKKAAVATDVPLSSELGKYILEQGGSAVDAAITSLLCVGLVDPQSSGLGGGFTMTVYMDKKAEVLMALQKAPKSAHPYMMRENEKYGVNSIAVPSQISGLWAAHQRYGKLEWKTLFEPVIDVARSGYPVSKHLSNVLSFYMADYSEIRNIYRNTDGALFTEGDIMTSPQMADTLEKIAHNGPWEFYKGSVGKALLQDIQNQGSLIDEDDFCPYQMEPTWEPVISTTFKNNLTMYTTPLPSSGPQLQYILNVLDGYSIYEESFKTNASKSLLYHRFLEATKSAFSLTRPVFGDEPESPNVTEMLATLDSKQFAQETRAFINDANATDTIHYQKPEVQSGKVRGTMLGDTSHVSVLAENGDAVSVTSSIGHYFGSRIYSESTGVFLNNQMSNFFYPGFEHHPNGIKPGRRFMSSICPTLLVDSACNVKMVIGSSGGFLITPVTAWVILRTLWTGCSLKQAIDEKRIYADEKLAVHVEEQGGVDDGSIHTIHNCLHNMGHTFTEDERFAVVQAILKDEQGGITAYSDNRKGGWAAGY